MLPTEYVTFPERRDRTEYVAARFARYLEGTVLDVGCFEAPLRAMIGAERYTGVDIAGDPDIQLDLDGVERLPFEAAQFQCVICIEVLEHLDNLHLMFEELLRVSARHVIVSLPNCWGDARRPIERGKGRFAHYGLPVERPLDRHKWFFSLGQARDFMEAKAAEHHLVIEEMFATEKPRSALVRWLRRLRYPGARYQNRYAQTLWTVLQKPAPKA